jgi:two-component system sensor histidine kinase SenX3
VAIAIAALIGLLVGASIAWIIRVGSQRHRRDSTQSVQPLVPRKRDRLAAETIVQLLPTAAVLLDADNEIRLANRMAFQLGLVRDNVLVVPALAELVRAARASDQIQTIETSVDTVGFPRRTAWVAATAQPLEAAEVALVVDDLTEAKRVEAVRRDFVANVGHEIKTPVGALQLLAEAALDAHDDPGAVQRFVGRMQLEAQRLARLVQELIDLSRLQGGEPLPEANEVFVDSVIDEALDRVHMAAEVKRISIARGGDHGLVVHGEQGQLVIAVANLLHNAIAYSGNGTRVGVGVHLRDDVIEIAVTDQGIGIADDDQERIFERFYRVDPARSRETGGTGLGLSIVKHAIGNHGGDVTVWSEPGSGSTFTIRLPTPRKTTHPVALPPPTLEEAGAQ